MSPVSPASKDMWSDFVRNYDRLYRNGPTTGGALLLVEAANTASPLSRASTILDIGCGGGQIVTEVLEKYNSVIPESTRIIASDFVKGMVNIVREDQKRHISSGNTKWERLETAVLDATDLSSFKDGECSHVLAGFVFNGLPNPAKALQEANRVLRPGGILVLTNVKSGEWVDLLQVIKDIRPDLPQPPTVKSFAPTWHEDADTKAHLEGARFQDVEVQEIPLTYSFSSYQELREKLFDSLPFLGKWLSEMTGEEIEKAKDLLVERTKGTYPSEPFALRGTATLAVGRKQSSLGMMG
ncbi:hypothetical protein AJ78_00737 [Emergomyces pasteurianus Ep9510]|uniref:Methyltransferase type 11 domain-containing protein n=1 Tax=Emergomyces pasteurianus Ep9510 TaxID=1447872 RepID=A0A1J9PS82_9EURO|nr:hypothetical protein AJ78_00737 [Emergomyces pasteurianus Ep9510]